MVKAKLFAVISSFLMLTGCGSFSESTPAVTVQSESSSDMMQSESSATVTFETNGTSDTAYTVQDVRNLNDFLLAKPTEEDLRGKPYDLDNDGVWSVFDLCLMKRKILEQRNMTTEFDFENKTVLLNSGYEMPILGLVHGHRTMILRKTLSTKR